MKKIFFTVFVNLVFILNSYSQLKNDSVMNDTSMVERFDYGIFKEKHDRRVSLQKGEWLIEITLYSDGKIDQEEYAPARDFYMIQKNYHSNGVLSFYCKYLRGVAFGERKYYDENGRLIELVDEDAKFGKLKPRDIVDFIEKIGLINRKTGESIILGKESPGRTDGMFYGLLVRRLDIYFFPAQYSKDGKEIKPPGWTIAYMKDGGTELQYTVNGNTGEYKLYERKIYSID